MLGLKLNHEFEQRGAAGPRADNRGDRPGQVDHDGGEPRHEENGAGRDGEA